MSEFRMPSLGSDMEDGVLVEQSVAPGDAVRPGDVIGAVETQKGVIEIEVFQNGTFERWLADIGTTVPVGGSLALIREPGEQPATGAKEPKPAPTIPQPAPPETVPLPPETEPVPPVTVPEPPETVPLPPETDPSPPEIEPSNPEIEPVPSEFPDTDVPEPTPASPELPDRPGGEPEEPPPEIDPFREATTRQKVTPAARRLAASRGIDLTGLQHPLNEPITRRDIEKLGAAKTTESATDFRSAIAAAMSRSKREIPHYYLAHDVDLTAAEQFVSERNAGRDPTERLLIGVVCAKAVAKAAAKYPEFNGHYTDNQFHPSEAVHLGFAINIRSGGLVAPALFDTDNIGLDALMQNMRDLTTRVRAGRFRARELSDATLTLTSLGERGTDTVFGVIYPPQVAIVGMGAPRMRPAVRDGELATRLTASLTLAADHRVSDGHRGALFLRAIDKLLQNPERL